MDLISVIIPVYNVSNYLEQCVKSVVSQTYKNLEIILVDDGSTDQSGVLCDQIKKRDDRIIVKHQDNKGLSAARNAGIDLATGQYIFFLDSDDVLELNCLMRLHNNLIKNDLDISCCHYTEFIAGNIVPQDLRMYYSFSPDDFMIKYFDAKFKNGVVIACNKLYKAALWKEIRFPEGLIHEDEFTTYKLIYKSNRIGYDFFVGYYYRKDNMQSITSNKIGSKHMVALDAYENYLEFFSEKSLLYHSMLVVYMHYMWVMNKRYILSKQEKQIIKSRFKNHLKEFLQYKGYSFVKKIKVFIQYLLL